MKKTNLFKILLTIMLGIVLIGTTSVFADDDIDINEFLDDGEEDGIIVDDKDAKSSEVKDTAVKSESENNTLSINNTNTTTTNNTTNKTSNNTSVYNNTNTPNSLSKAGLEDSIPTMVLIVIFGISAIYAYKKIGDYKNI